MVRHGGHLWVRHPGVKSGKSLTLGERAADVLKHYFGTWAFLFSVVIVETGWMIVQSVILKHPFDPYPYILLNLGLSTLAAMQGSALQISSNRGDFISAQVAEHTRLNTEQLITMNKEMLLLLLQQVAHLNEEMDAARERDASDLGTIQVALNTLAGRIDKLDRDTATMDADMKNIYVFIGDTRKKRDA